MLVGLANDRCFIIHANLWIADILQAGILLQKVFKSRLSYERHFLGPWRPAAWMHDTLGMIRSVSSRTNDF